MRLKKNGERWFMDESYQRQAEIVAAEGKHILPTPRQMLLTHMEQALGHLDWYAPACGIDEAMNVRLARMGLRLLIQFLRGSK